MNHAAARDLRTIATTWTDLTDALGAPAQLGAFGIGLRSYLAALEQYDPTEAAAARALERDPAQLGERPIPIRLHVYATMRSVEAALIECADSIARDNQRDPMQPFGPDRRTRLDPRVYTAADRHRRAKLAAADATDPQRWRFVGTRTATYAALWLCARVEGMRGPQTPLTVAQHRHIARVAAGAVERIERALDTGAETATLAPPCPNCGGTITVHGGAGASPLANCPDCGGIWTEQGAAA